MNMVKIFRYVDDFLVVLGEYRANCMKHAVAKNLKFFRSLSERLNITWQNA